MGLHPIPCPSGSTTTKFGATVCDICWGPDITCPPNTYLNTDITPSKCCPREIGAIGTCPGEKPYLFSASRDCLPCDECTDVKVTYMHNCRTDPSKLWSTFNKLRPTCKQVTTCAAWTSSLGTGDSTANGDVVRTVQPYNTYADPNTYTQNMVLAADSRTACQYMYDAKLPGNGKSGATPSKGATSRLTNGVLSGMYMPFQFGYMRQYGAFGFVHAATVTVASDFQADQLAFYENCSRYGELLIPAPAHSIGMDDSQAMALLANNSLHLGLKGAWGADCDPFMTHVCVANMTAQFMTYTSKNVGVVSYLSRCTPCPPNSLSQIGLNEDCQCWQGYGNIGQLSANFQNRNFDFLNKGCYINYAIKEGAITGSGSVEGYCYGCLDSLYVECPNDGLTYIQAVVCSSTNGTFKVEVCPWSDYVHQNGTCVKVPGGYFSIPGQSGIRKCAAGTFSNNLLNSCQACPPSTFSGSGSASCTPKRPNCSVGQILMLDPQNFTDDDQCKPCEGCKPGFIEVVQSGYNTSNPCPGTQYKHFACASNTLAQDMPAGRRLVFNAAYNLDDPLGNGYDSVRREVCNPQWLPADAEWVRAPSQQVVPQCYFTCLYDLGPGASTLQARLNALWAGDDVLRSIQRVSRAYYPFINSPKVRVPKRWAQDGDDKFTYGTWAINANPSQAPYYHQSTNDLYASKAIFYFDDATMAAWPMGNTSMAVCAPQAQLLHASTCAADLYADTNINAMWRLAPATTTQCTYLAATTGIFSLYAFNATQVYPTYVVLGPPLLTDSTGSYVPLCVANVNNDGVITGWTYACMQEQADATASAVARLLSNGYSYVFSDKEKILLFEIQQWLQINAWYTAQGGPQSTKFYNPYTYNTTQGVRCVSQTTLGTPLNRLNSVNVVYTPSVITATTVQQVLSDFGINGISACVPCTTGTADVLSTQICPNGNAGSAQTLFFDPSLCVAMGMQLSDVCTSCKTDSTTHVPVSSIEQRKLLLDNIGISNYWGDPGHPCMYQCASTSCSTAAQFSYADYKQTPCHDCELLRATWLSQCGAGTCQNPALAQCGSSGIRHVNVCPSLCVPCMRQNTSLPLVGFSGAAAVSQDACATMCDPNLYHTLLTNGSMTTRPVPQSLIADCVLCTSMLSLVCNGACPNGNWYHPDDQNCVACNTTTCDAKVGQYSNYSNHSVVGQYRTGCTGNNSVADTACVACDATMLQNPDVVDELPLMNSQSRKPNVQRAMLTNAINSVANTITRRWVLPSSDYANRNPPQLLRQYGVMAVTPSDMTHGSTPCYIACANNMVWMTSSGQYPTTPQPPVYDPTHLYCIPCNSPYFSSVDSAVEAPIPQLYSVWNQIGDLSNQTSTNPIVQSMQNFPGKTAFAMFCNIFGNISGLVWHEQAHATTAKMTSTSLTPRMTVCACLIVDIRTIPPSFRPPFPWSYQTLTYCMARPAASRLLHLRPRRSPSWITRGCTPAASLRP